MTGLIAIPAYRTYSPQSSYPCENSPAIPKEAAAGTAGGRISSPSAGTRINRASLPDRAAVSEKPAISQQMRRMLRSLRQTPHSEENPLTRMPGEDTNGLSGLSDTPDEEDAQDEKKAVNYNYKEIASKIQRAKTPLSAGQAVLSAKRKVLELKRKISAKAGDAEELQLALTHARRMEMTARRKKHHLELEEMAENLQKRNASTENTEGSSANPQNAVLRAGEEKLEEQEDAMALLENMELLDPHMSKTELDGLKQKHRAAENKAIVKADMDYLKDLMRHLQGQAGSMPGMNASGFGVISGSAGVSISASVSGDPAPDGGMIDLQV